MTDRKPSIERVNRFDRDWWIKHRDRAFEHKWYSIGRIDLLIISISAGGIYIAFEVLKFLKVEKFSVDESFLKLSGLAFAVAIIFNFLSQLFAVEAHQCEAIWAKHKINQARNKPSDLKEIAKVDRQVEFFNGGVFITHYLSIIAMFFGIILLTYFNLFTL
jgi:hypothetical protein